MNKETVKDFIVSQFSLSPAPVQRHIKKILKLLVAEDKPLTYQLLLCMAIDLNHGSLPIDRYEALLYKVDVKQPVDQFFTQFQDAIKAIVHTEGPLFSGYTNNTHIRANCQKYATIMKKEDVDKYYTFPSPTTGKWKTYSSSYRKLPVDNLLARGYTDTHIKKPKPSVFWLAPREWVEGILTVHGDEAATILVDLLGLKHLSHDGTELMYMELPAGLIPTAYQSTTAQATWNTTIKIKKADGSPEDVPYSPFLSYGNIDGWGRTFSLRAKNHKNQGFERIIDVINVDTDDKKKQIILHKISGTVKGLSTHDNRDGLIDEGLKRFKTV